MRLYYLSQYLSQNHSRIRFVASSVFAKSGLWNSEIYLKVIQDVLEFKEGNLHHIIILEIPFMTRFKQADRK